MGLDLSFVAAKRSCLYCISRFHCRVLGREGTLVKYLGLGQDCGQPMCQGGGIRERGGENIHVGSGGGGGMA